MTVQGGVLFSIQSEEARRVVGKSRRGLLPRNSLYGPRKRSGRLENVEKWSRLWWYRNLLNMPLVEGKG